MFSVLYANFAPDATAFAAGEYNLRQTNGSGHASNESKIIFLTSQRETFTRCCNSITLAARNFSIVLPPIKIGHAHASRTRNCPNGIVFV